MVDLSVAPARSYSKVEGIPCVRSGSLDRSGIGSSGSCSWGVVDLASVSAADDGGGGGGGGDGGASGCFGCCCCSAAAFCDGDCFGALNLDLLSLAIPRAHTAGNVWRGRADDAAKAAALAPATGRAAARASIMTFVVWMLLLQSLGGPPRSWLRSAISYERIEVEAAGCEDGLQVVKVLQSQ